MGLLGNHADGSALQEGAPQGSAQHEALQVLTLAQRTAEEHLISARHEADRICAEARDQAGQIIRDAEGRREALRQEAEGSLAEARAAATRIVNDAQAQADHTQQEAEEILADAQRRADELAKMAQAKADELQQLAEQRYEDVVGSLASRRESLQQQIEALERFDREYRARLQAFMQHQLRSLWVDEPRVEPDEDDQPEPARASAAVPAQRDDSEHYAEHYAEHAEH